MAVERPYGGRDYAIKILFVTNSMHVGGIEKNIVRLAAELTGRGHMVFVASRGGELVADAQAAGARVVSLAMTPRRPDRVLSDARTLSALVTRERPDVVHVFSATAAAFIGLTRIILRLPGARTSMPPVVASVMGLQSSPDESNLAVRLRVFALAMGARRLIVTAPAIDSVVRSLPISRSRIVHQSVVGVDVHPPRDPGGDRDLLRRELGVPADRRLVTTVGRLVPIKSHELFIQAAALVMRARNDVTFLVVGDGEEEARLQAEVQALGVDGVVRFLGNRDDVDLVLGASDVCVRPGTVEGFVGITVLEAQALGIPVVSFETEDVRLAIEDNHTGLLVPCADVTGLAEAVLRILDDGLLAERLGEAGRQHVSSTYSLPAVVSALEALYIETVKREEVA